MPKSFTGGEERMWSEDGPSPDAFFLRVGIESQEVVVWGSSGSLSWKGSGCCLQVNRSSGLAGHGSLLRVGFR